MKKFCVVLILFGSASLLSGCGDKMKRTFGMDRMPPDEFQVVERAPLVMPPNYHLDPPKPGERRPQEMDTKSRAVQSVLGENKENYGANESSGLYEFMTLAGTEKANPQIRSIVETDNKAMIKADKSFVDKIVFWQDQAPLGDVVEPVQEAARIKKNKADGKPVTEGETPTIIRKKKAPLEGLFN